MRWRVEAASKNVVNAKTQFYPNINLVAFAGFPSIGLGRLLASGGQQWGVGPALRLPIFDAGRLRANLRGKAASLDAAIERYKAGLGNYLNVLTAGTSLLAQRRLAVDLAGRALQIMRDKGKELTEEHPVVALSLFKRRNFWAGVMAISVGYGLFFGNVVVVQHAGRFRHPPDSPGHPGRGHGLLIPLMTIAGGADAAAGAH